MDGFRFHSEGVRLSDGNVRRANAELIVAINSNDAMLQCSGLQMLCDQLTMNSFISPSTMATVPLVMPALLRLIASSYMREVSITAARALTYILDAFPRTFETLPSRNTLATVLLRHLSSIEDVELSEQCISCLELISRTQVGSAELLTSGGVEAVLSFVDFFTLHKQRQIWTIVQRLVGELDETSVRFITPCLPTLRMGVTSGDAEIRQKAIATLAQAVEGVKTDRAVVEVVFGDAADRVAALLHERDLNDESLSSALSLLYAGVQWSASIAASVIRSDLFSTLLDLLRPPPPVATAASSPATEHTPGSPSPRGAETRDSGGAQLVVDDDPARGGGAGASEPVRATTITSHQRAIVCRLLASLLVPCRTAAALRLERLEALTQRSLLFGGPARGDAHGGDSDGDEDYEEEEEEDYSTTDDDGEGYGDEDGEDTEYDSDPDATLADLRQRIAEAPRIKVQTKASYARCRASGFLCDGCGKSCTPGDWYRCNDCSDKDFCAACLLEHHADDHSGEHSYTDMEVVVGVTARNRDKLELYSKSPELLHRVLEAIPTVVDVCISSELATLRASCLDFLAAAVDMAAPEQLTASEVTKAALGEVLNNNLRGTDLVCNALAVTLAGRLLVKAGGTWQVQFVREGVKLSLQLLKQRCKVKGRTTLTRETVATLMTTVAGWRTIIGTEAAALLHRFLGAEDEQATESLRRVALELRQDHFSAALQLLSTALNADVTTFEVFSSGVVRELLSCLGRQQSVFAVMQLVAVLSGFSAASPAGDADKAARGTGSSSSLSSSASPPSAVPGGHAPNSGSSGGLRLFVHHLHTILTLLDDFAVPTYDFLGGVDKYFVVAFEPHRASVVVAGDTATAALAASLRSAGASSAMSPRQCVKARIRPLSTVGAMAQVLRQEVLHQEDTRESGGGGGGGANDDESIVNVLPDLHPRHPPPSSRGAPAPAASTSPPRAAARVDTTTSVWIRYGPHILPPSMTMLQILEQLVLPAAVVAEEETSRQHHGRRAPRHRPRAAHRTATEDAEDAEEAEQAEEGSGAGRAPRSRRVPRDTSNTAGYSLQKPVMLYYSTTPFSPQHYSMFQVANSFPASGEPAAPIRVCLPSQDSAPTAVREVMQQLVDALPHSRQELTDGQRDVLGLLGVVHAAVANWPALLAYTRQQAAAGSPKLCGADAACILETFAPAISAVDFQHAKLNNKAIQHCSQLPLAGQQRGTWAVKLALDCHFLFSYVTRKFLFDIAFTSTDRCLVQMRKYRELFGLTELRVSRELLRGIYGQLRKEAKRVWREDVLKCAKSVLMAPDAGARNVVWGFQFYNENGWGDGPTREFYNLVSGELRQRTLRLWRCSDEASGDGECDAGVLGFYPRPVPPALVEERQRLAYNFETIGRFIGRALADEHVPGLALSRTLLRLLRGDVCGVHDVQDISEELGGLLVALADAGGRGKSVLQLPGHKTTVAVEDLGLDFTLPGDDSVELRPNGANVAVTAENALAYCDAVAAFLLKDGVAASVRALRQGFHWYTPLVALQMLSVDELYHLLAGHDSVVTRDEFELYSEANYGYTLHCKHVQWLFDILTSFTVEEQQRFFLFLTGSAHLPVGGLSRLRPCFTIVRKVAEDTSVKEQDMLPSAMTCQNYLKLPQYTTKEEMESKLRLAMEEGAGAFLLS
ncbi:HECT-domain (ubiquitin-transferase) [Novymonas esmeraldas]|uniref:HECT-type E3 ubiquitin transferase n=1 Tax=Novymonas esmeraldas TaxID=1808958 RepID=A0AAW0F3M6_9TRYP